MRNSGARTGAALLLGATSSVALGQSPSGAAVPVTENGVKSPVNIETLVQSNAAWDATPYTAYPHGQPLLSVLRITIAPHTALEWHSHRMPNAAYVISGELTLEEPDGTRRHFVAGHAITETVNRIHRGVTGETPVVLIVFYAGTLGLPLSQPEPGPGLTR
jgi:quercetin dioxygenase-like cupin family protein